MPIEFEHADLAAEGFVGWKTLRELREEGVSDIPKAGGVYVVSRESITPPAFLERSPAGHFKGKDPMVSVEKLQSNWVDGAQVLYIGKGNNLHKRLKDYMTFGEGKSAPHHGGRYIWQIDGAEELIVAWKETGDDKPGDVETRMLEESHGVYGQLLFANLRW